MYFFIKTSFLISIFYEPIMKKGRLKDD